jgi:hypothetical protein
MKYQADSAVPAAATCIKRIERKLDPFLFPIFKPFVLLTACGDYPGSFPY